MSKEHKRINYDLAKAEADKVDEQIIAALQNGNSFVWKLAQAPARHIR